MSDHAAIVRKAHADAMMALAADVHPYTKSAIDAHEKAMDAALDALVKERDAANLLLHGLTNEADANAAWKALILRAEAAESERDEALEQRDAALIRASENRQRAEAAEARVTELEAASKRIRHIAENIADPYNRDERRIAWAEEIIALAAPTKEGT